MRTKLWVRLAVGLVMSASAISLHAACPDFTPLGTRPNTGNQSYAIANGDFNADGKRDLVVANVASNNISVMMGNGDGTFGARTNYSASAAPSGVAVGDFNGDNRQDLATSAAGSNVGVFINNGAGGFAARVGYSAGDSPADVAIGDLNGDGRLDLAVASSPGVNVLLGNGNGTFGTATGFAAGGYTNDVSIADFNNDNKLDLALVSTGANNVAVLLGNGAGSFGAATTFAVGSSPMSASVADLNHDGRQDIVTSNHASENISVLLGNGSGGFAAAVNYSASNLYEMDIADFNNDGHPDVVAISVDSNAAFVFTGTGTGTFGASVQYPLNPPAFLSPYAVTAADYNDDGGIDLAVCNFDGNNVTIALNGCSTRPSISGINPNLGPSAGGQAVVITGSNLGSASSVKFDTTNAAITNNTPTSITVTTPAHAGGPVNVVVTAPLGTATSTNGYVYFDPPTATSVSPNTGSTAGGLAGVVITGTNLAGTTNVDFGGSGAVITNTSATTVTVTTPNHAAGAVDVVVTTPGGTATVTNGFTYLPAPTISSVSPNAGPAAGGQTGVVITGTNLSGATSVTMGGTAATITNNTATTVTVTTPARAAGLVNVVVTTAVGSVTANNAYRFVAAPNVTSRNPTAGPTAGGQTVTIGGTNLSNATVTFDGITASVGANTATSITTTSPAHAAGPVNLTVTTTGGSSSTTYTYVDAPTFTSIAPAAGPTAGGQTGVVITGTNLANATQVRFATTNATITNNTATTVTVTTPARTAGTVNVSVTTAGGTATSNNAYTYVAAPTITGVSPNSGPSAGGQTGVVISGTNLSTVSSITFGGTAATITNTTNGAITVTTPAHAAGAVNVVVTTAGGTATSNNAYTYIDAPTITNINPTNGPIAGGQTGVVITGTALSNASSVKFDGLNATITNNGSTSITVTTPPHPVAGSVSVVVTTIGGTASTTYTYLAGAATRFGVSAPSSATAGAPLSFTVTAYDANNNVATGYGGTVQFTSNDAAATLPANATLTNGTATFNATLHTAGSRTITATDTVSSAINGTSNAIDVGTGAATHFRISAPLSTPAGTPLTFTITALDASNNTVTGYAGTVHFTSSDGAATLPADSTLTNGTGSFNATLHTSGSHTIGATDGSINGTSNAIDVLAGAATQLAITAPSTATAGTAFSITVTALDAHGNIATGYTGTLHFTSNDPSATLPMDNILTNGSGTFSATLRQAGMFNTISTGDGVLGTTSNNIHVVADRAVRFGVGTDTQSTAGWSVPVFVQAIDAYGNVDTGYSGIVHFTSTDPIASLPGDATLTNGYGAFSATLYTGGVRFIIATDTVDGTITGTSNGVTVRAADATHFTISAPSSAGAGTPFDVTVTARDAFENLKGNYNGTIHFSSSDGAAVLPADGPLVNGSGTFSVSLNTVGAQTVSATDGSLGGTSNNIDVTAGSAVRFTVSAPAAATAGTPFSFTVTALDAANNVAVGYTGTAHFTSTDASATLPADATLTNGTGTFNATLRTAATQTITATDTVTNTIIGTSASIDVAAAATHHLLLITPASATAGTPAPFTVMARDAFGNTTPAYGGTLHFTSTDAVATLPADSTLTNGIGTFDVTLATVGPQRIFANDGTLDSTSNPIDVVAGAATHFRVDAPSSTIAGASFAFTVTPLDAFENVTTFAGLVHFTSTDATATLPADAAPGTLNAALRTAGDQTITATAGAVTGISNVIDVDPAEATHFRVDAPSSTIAGASFAFTVTPLDAFENVTTFAGLVHFTSTDATATLPADAAPGTLNATLRIAGDQTITATAGAVTGTSNVIDVDPAEATHFRVDTPSSTTAGASFTFTVTPLDAFENVASFPGLVHFTSTDAVATLPADSAPGTLNATLRTAGDHTITATAGAVTGTSNVIDVDPAVATHFRVDAPSSTSAGASFAFTVTPLDAFENVTTFAGLVHFTSTDAAATLPADSAIGTFNAMLRTAGDQTITATAGAVTGTSNAIDVDPGEATHFRVDAPSSTIAGASFAFTVTPLDAFENVTTFAGLVHFTSTDAAATLPADSAIGTFNATLRTAGDQTITATAGAVTGTSNVIDVDPAEATHFRVDAPASTIAGASFAFIVTPLDAFENVTTFAGLVHFTSTDATATLPADSALGTFNATLRTAGDQTITATAGAVTGTSNVIDVNPGAADRFIVEAAGGGNLATQTAGAPFGIRVVARDAFGNPDTNFTGIVALSTTAGTIAPPSVAFVAGDAGVGNATVTVTLAGSNRTITASSAAGNGTSSPFAVDAGSLQHFRIEAAGGGAIPTQTANIPFAIRIVALDANDNVAVSFHGTAVVSSSGTLSGGSTTSAFTNGVLASHDVTINSSGATTITATSGAFHGTSNSFLVDARADLDVGLTGPATTTAGAQAVYTLVVSNDGPTTAIAPVVSLTLPNGWRLVSTSAPCASGFPCTLAERPAPSSITMQLTASVPQNATGSHEITASITSTTDDPSSANNRASTRTTISEVICELPAPLFVGAVAEISSGATYHVSWNDAGAAQYEVQESRDASFANATTTITNETSIERKHEVSATTPFHYRVRPIVPCLGELPFGSAIRVVVQPLGEGGDVVDLMVENGANDVLAQRVHLDTRASADGSELASFTATSDQPWVVVTPTSGSIPPSGAELDLSVHAAGHPAGTSVANVRIVAADGSALRDIRVNLHAGMPMTLQARALPIPSNALLLPAVGHAPGINVLWRSDVRLHNPSGTPATYAMTFTPTGTDGTIEGKRVQVQVDAATTVAFDDIVRRVFGYGAIENESAIGSLEVRPLASDARAVMSSRTYALTPDGTYGQAIPPLASSALAETGSVLSLQHLAQSDTYRTNIGLVEGAGHAAAVRVHVYDASGHELTQFDVNLGRLEHRQFNALLAEHGITSDNVRIDLELLSTDARIGAYASMVDNRTADPTLIPGRKPSQIQASRYVVPGVADLNTGRNAWRTDVRIYNAAPASVTADLVFIEQSTTTMTTRQVTIAAGETKAFDSILRTLFGANGTGGALHVVTSSLSNLVITARTYDAKGANQDEGTYGQFIPAVTPEEATGIGDAALDILQLEQSAAYRTNVGFAEVSGHSAQVEATATLADGRTATMTFDLAPFEFRQIVSMLRVLGIDTAANASLAIRVVGGAGRITGYASVIDNETGDPTYMYAQ